MDLIYQLLVVLHLLGMAALVGGYLSGVTRRWAAGGGPGPVMVWGARAQLVTGVLLVGVAEMTDDELDYAKITVKLVVTLVVAGLTEVAAGRDRRSGGTVSVGLLHAAGGLGIVNVLVAVLWT